MDHRYVHGVARWVAGTLAAVVLPLVVVWSALDRGGESFWFALIVVWGPMTWVGTVSRVVQLRLPARYHALRAFERSGRVYELVGVRAFKMGLRRGPLAMFNPDLHLPAEPTPARLAHLEQRMRDAEASHAVLFAATLLVVAHAALRGWWWAGVWTLVFDVLMNGYPVMLQRYNRAWLRRRFDELDRGDRLVAEPIVDAGLVNPAAETIAGRSAAGPDREVSRRRRR
jgi:hypothetical protein